MKDLIFDDTIVSCHFWRKKTYFQYASGRLLDGNTGHPLAYFRNSDNNRTAAIDCSTGHVLAVTITDSFRDDYDGLRWLADSWLTGRGDNNGGTDRKAKGRGKDA